MIAGGLGNVRRPARGEERGRRSARTLVVLGGPAMLIGLGGGAASSVGSGSSAEELDFASVQRGNAEIQRRAQEVIDRCWALGDDNPIQLIHDVGAGGLSNAVPEAVAHSRRGARIELREIPNAEPGMSPLEIWCNEAQERYVLALDPGGLARLRAIAQRERCPLRRDRRDHRRRRAGGARSRVRQRSGQHADRGAARQAAAHAPRRAQRRSRPRSAAASVTSICEQRGPARSALSRAAAAGGRRQDVSDHDRRSHRRRPDQPRPVGRTVAGAGRRCRPSRWRTISTMPARRWRSASARRWRCSMPRPRRGWRSPRRSPTSWRRTSRALADVRLSANWMAACGEPGEDAALYAAVRAVGEELCPALGIAIPVGKDSLSMKTAWQDGAGTDRWSRRYRSSSRHSRRCATCAAPGPRCCSSISGPSVLLLVDLGARPQSPRDERAGAGVQRGGRRLRPTRRTPACWPRLPRR